MARRLAAADWPAWTDDDRWTIDDDAAPDPDPEDSAWWAQESAAHDEDLPDAAWDDMAEEARARECLERGCWL